jgi:dTDP-4-amino-4,6-dideoxygalactose transaminase
VKLPPRGARVPLVDLGPQHAEVGEEALAAVAELARGGTFILGEAVLRFEEQLAKMVGAAYAVGVASGTDALVLGLVAAGVRAGDLVVVPAVTFAATAEAVVRAGGEPLFVEPDPTTFCLAPSGVRARIEALPAADRARVRALVPVHLFGRACDMRGLAAVAEEHGLAIVEDAAQALGGRTGGKALGTFGVAGAYSFFPTKNLGAWGDGGAVVTDRDDVAARVRSLRQHGSEGGRFTALGMNSRLDAVQAAVLAVKAPRLEGWTRARIAAGERYRSLLAGALPAGALLQDAGGEGEHVYHQLVVRVAEREAFQERLAGEGIETRAYYTRPLYAEEAFARYASAGDDAARSIAGTLVALPMFYGISEEQQRCVADAVRHAAR